jgi:hypothetical protein
MTLLDSMIVIARRAARRRRRPGGAVTIPFGDKLSALCALSMIVTLAVLLAGGAVLVAL